MDLDVERDGHVVTLGLNRQSVLNALDRKLLSDLHAAVRDLAHDRDVRVAVLTGRGPRAFCVGLDLKEGRCLSPAQALELATLVGNVQDDLEALAVPVIAAVEGYALGSGFELCLVCDLRVASEKAEFGLPEVRLGRFPGGGATSRLPRLVGEAFAREVVYTGRRFGALEAERVGLLNRVVPAGTAYATACELAHAIAANAPLGIRAAKAAFTLTPGGMRAGLERDKAVWALCHASEDYQEGMAAYAEKRPPSFKGH